MCNLNTLKQSEFFGDYDFVFKLEPPYKPKVKEINTDNTINYLDRLNQVIIFNLRGSLRIRYYHHMMRKMMNHLITIGRMSFNVSYRMCI